MNNITAGVVRRLFGEETSTPLRMLAKQKQRLEMQEAGRQAAAAQSASTNNQGQGPEDTQDLADLDPSGPTDVPQPPEGDGLWSQILDFLGP